MIRHGYGSSTEEMESVVAPGKLTNRNIVIQLSGKQERRITDIDAGYTLIPGGAPVNFEGGRLLVVGTKFESYSDIIDPNSANLPDSLSSANVYHDVHFGQTYPFTNDIPRYSYHTSKGIHIPKGTDASVILTFAQTDDATFPDSSLHIGFLNVDGFSGGSDAPLKNIR